MFICELISVLFDFHEEAVFDSGISVAARLKPSVVCLSLKGAGRLLSLFYCATSTLNVYDGVMEKTEINIFYKTKAVSGFTRRGQWIIKSSF